MKRSILVAVLAFLGFGIFAQGKKDALVLYRNGNYKESIAVCEEEIKADPSHVDSYVVLCWSLVANREYARAEQRAYDGLKIERYDIRLIEVLGEAKFYLGKNEEALKQFQEYISIANDRTGSRVGVAYYFMGEIYIRQSKFQHADIAFSAAVRKEPNSDSWWTRLGYAREMAGNYPESLAAYNEALRLNPSKTDAVRGKERVSEHIR
ncbi:MAG: tetratricopeptide repeat protein [Treponema sp.]|uniref:tetratricopeptide repeat protein n=1 Tax=Treponema sp. TaxID=166 RepID=UPI001B6293B5|nr:tetratricopeptide repeat protein [Treponema sp.]MBP5587883.1 tetratricopeptide repeat protein [Treponema sp.]MBR0155743.1 tetratricopeptide repeat protein [Treponema sp.]MCR5386135.1 tetratricopeptide repeat protein [Treponema sp.]